VPGGVFCFFPRRPFFFNFLFFLTMNKIMKKIWEWSKVLFWVVMALLFLYWVEPVNEALRG
jgi:hypothetical protein